jgi:hypothetical protein
MGVVEDANAAVWFKSSDRTIISSEFALVMEHQANRLMVAESTAPPNIEGYGGTSVPPPARLIRSGARDRTAERNPFFSADGVNIDVLSGFLRGSTCI